MKEIEYHYKPDPKTNYEARIEMLNKIQPFYFTFVGGMFLLGAFTFGF